MEKSKVYDYFEDFGEWLRKNKKYDKKTISSRMSNIRALAGYYDILKEYSIDECESVFDELQYSRKDIEPKTSVTIKGDYYNGLATYRNVLRLFVEYLKHIGYMNSNATTIATAKYVGGFEEFKRYVGPKCRNEVNIFCKSEREKHNGICEYCGKTAVLQSAHITERPVIIKNILEHNYQLVKGMDSYEVPLEEFFVKFKEAHMPIKDHIFFLCKNCHDGLDKHNTISIADILSERNKKSKN